MKHCIKSVLFLCLSGFPLFVNALPQDEAYNRLSSKFYTSVVTRNPSVKAVSKISELVRQIEKHPDQAVINIATIEKSVNALMDGVEDNAFTTVIDYMLSYGETRLAEEFLQEFEDYGDSFGASKIYFSVAKYYERRGDWQRVLDNINRIDLSALTKENNDYALLLHGYALQATKKHRKAAKVYDRLETDSTYSPHAKLNKGIAFLRQGWWTEGHLEIQAGLKGSFAHSNELKNRMRNTLAYSQMREGFYRDARETFRDIELDSIHANKAIIGLGICATYQKDFIGALNAFAVLKKRPIKDFSVDESYLLVPYIYEQLDQLSTASVAYADAVSYFENRILELQNQKRRYQSADTEELIKLGYAYLSDNNALYGLKAQVPEHAFKRLVAVSQMQQLNTDPVLKVALNALVEMASQEVVKNAHESLDMHLEMLSSYSGQAKYGIAKLYDE